MPRTASRTTRTADTTSGAARIATLAAVPITLLAGVLAFWSLGGFRSAEDTGGPAPLSTGPVGMAAPGLDERAGAVCPVLIARLPEALRDRPSRPVTAGADQNAAYGDPPLTLSCGTPLPPYPPEATLNGLSGVCWYTEKGAAADRWTTVDRAVPVTVVVPHEYEPAGQWVIDFSPAIRDVVPAAERIPFGCRG